MYNILNEINNYCKECKYYNGNFRCNLYGYNIDIRRDEHTVNEILNKRCFNMTKPLNIQDIVLLKNFLNNINVNDILNIETNKENSYFIFTINNNKFAISKSNVDKNNFKSYEFNTKNKSYKISNVINEEKELIKHMDKLFNKIMEKYLTNNIDIFDLI